MHLDLGTILRCMYYDDTTWRKHTSLVARCYFFGCAAAIHDFGSWFCQSKKEKLSSSTRRSKRAYYSTNPAKPLIFMRLTFRGMNGNNVKKYDSCTVCGAITYPCSYRIYPDILHDMLPSAVWAENLYPENRNGARLLVRGLVKFHSAVA